MNWFAIRKKLLKMVVRFIPNHRWRVPIFRMCGYQVGQKVMVGEDLIIVEMANNRTVQLIIGDRVSIAQRVTLILASGANWSRLKRLFPAKAGDITINNDAWIGAGSIILPGITIGEASIVAAGAVVTQDVPPYTVVAGVPAKVIKEFAAEWEAYDS